MSRIFCIMALVGIGLFPLQSQAGYTYYVATTGSDSNPGTSATPFQTVQRGVDVARAGDTVYVRAGTYTENIVMQYSGEPDNPITLRNSPGERPVLRYDASFGNNVVRRLTLEAREGFQKPIGWITIEGFEMTKGWEGIKIYNGYDIVIRNNYIHNNIGNGILGNGYRILIDSNIIAHNGFGDVTVPDMSNQIHGIYLSGQHIKITNNVIRSNRAYGVQVAGYPYDSSSHFSAEYAEAKYWLIAHNIFAYSYNRPGLVVWQPDANANTISNNIFYENMTNRDVGGTHQGIQFYYSGSHNVVNNNLFYSSTDKLEISDTADGASYTSSHNINGQLPLFVDAAAFNFYLGPSSPVINAGQNVAEVLLDFDCKRRPAGSAYDIGAYEYGGVADPACSSINLAVEGSTSTGPAVAAHGGELSLVIPGEDNGIYHARINSEVRPTWEQLGGTTSSEPAAVEFNGELWIFIRGMDNLVYQNRLTAEGWAGWDEVPGGGSTLSGPGAVVFNNELYLFVQGMEDKIYQNRLLVEGWAGWEEVPGGKTTQNAPAAVVFQSTLYLVVRGSDNHIYDNLLTSDGVWAGWLEVPADGLTPSGPGAAVFGGELWYFVRGMDDRIYQNRLPAEVAGEWTGWSELTGDGLTLSRPGAVATATTLYLAVRGADSQISLRSVSPFP